MKYSAALKQSEASLRVLLVVVPAVWALYFWMRDWLVAVILYWFSVKRRMA